ncbi:MAG: GNAT family N-acetyltransferase [Deltaproteobacteria bacterium]|nr:GNAT family N-acetyltransferase [Deltaproteobacteria bacterium]
MTPPIRPAAHKDLEDILRVQRASLSNPWSQELTQGVLRTGKFTVRVAEISGQVVGYAIFHPRDTLSNLDQVAVAPPHRRQGLGRMLVADWLAQAKSQGFVRYSLQVNPSNQAAQNLYLQAGFRFHRQLPAYYPNQEDAIEMVLGQGIPDLPSVSPAFPSPTPRPAPKPPPGSPLAPPKT